MNNQQQQGFAEAQQHQKPQIDKPSSIFGDYKMSPVVSGGVVKLSRQPKTKEDYPSWDSVYGQQ